MRLTTKTNTQDYHAFGSVMAGRSFSNEKYKFGFNGMEKDNETFIDAYDFGARILDTRIGRWLALDPVVNPSWSQFASFKNSPICIIDPTGETDFYNTAGKWIGTDGNNEKASITIICDTKLEKEINKLAKKGQDFKNELPNGSFHNLPSDNVNKATLKVFDMMSTDVDGIENSAGAHEAGTTFDKNDKNLGFSNSNKILTQQMANDQILLSIPAEISVDYNVTAEQVSGGTTIHAHVTKIFEVKINENFKAVEFSVFDPSPTDVKTNLNAELNIIVGNDKSSLEPKATVVGPNKFKSEEIRVPRISYAAYYDKNSTLKFTIEIGSLRKIMDGSGKTESKTHDKYKKRSNSGEN